ncbi:MAG: hypothetical protein K2H76_08020 [Muribaculaceae bacterium]|nr:hypothetical protein [Muribaculaceae bacterium]
MGIFDRFTRKKRDVKVSCQDNAKKSYAENQTRQETRENESRSSKVNRDDVNDALWHSFLMNEAKFRHQEMKVERSSKETPVDLRYILKNLLDIIPEEIGSMTVVRKNGLDEMNETEEIESQEAILGYKPFDAVMVEDKEGKMRPRPGMNVVLILSYRPSSKVFSNTWDVKDKSKQYTDNSIILFLRLMGPFVSETAYMRVSVMIPNDAGTDDFRTQNSKNAPFTTSFILGFDMTDPKERLKRFAEIEHSLQKKASRGESLSIEEAAIWEGLTYTRNLGEDFEYGQWLVKENRFSDALIPLRRIYKLLKKKVVSDFERFREIFEETCYNIGFCYTELGQYEKAAYYLKLIQGAHNPVYAVEYINALVNGGSPMALAVVRNHISQFGEGKKEINSEETSNFYDFLCRRLAYLYVEYEMWDDALKVLEQIKDRPGCRDYALEEIRYIKRERRGI